MRVSSPRPDKSKRNFFLRQLRRLRACCGKKEAPLREQFCQNGDKSRTVLEIGALSQVLTDKLQAALLSQLRVLHHNHTNHNVTSTT